MRAWWSRVPRDARIAAVLAGLVILQTVALAAFGFAAVRSQRAEAEQGLRALCDLALQRGIAAPVAEALDRAGAAVAAAARAPAPEAAAARLDPPVFRRGFALLPDGSVADGTGVVVVPAGAPRDPPVDAALRRRLEDLEAAAAREGKGREAARAALEAAEATGDPLAGARALRFAAREALRAGEDTLALRAAERLLDRWPDAVEEGAYPFGPGAAAAACEVWRRRLEARAPGAGEGFAEAVLRWRRLLLRSPLPPAVSAAEAAEVRRAVAAAAALLAGPEARRVEEGLAALDLADREADAVRPESVRSALREAAGGGKPRWVSVPGMGGEPLAFCAAPAAGRGAVAFRTDAPALREGIVLPLLRGFDLREGVAARLLTPDRRPLDGGPPAPPRRAILAARAVELPTGPVLAEAVLADPALLEAEAARGRNLLLGVFAAAAAALGLGALLVIRMVRSEVRLARMKADFVSAVSHDLKTPLTSIRMFLETLREGRTRSEGERQECLEIVDREAGRLERLVNRVLEFSRHASGLARVRRAPVDPAEVVRDAAQVFRGHILNGECDFRVEAADGLPVTPLDRDAVTQVVLDLLENAYKYTPAGGKRILLRAAPRPGGGFRIEVEDNGPGVPPGEREKVFEEFYRVERPGTEGAGGTGLGLALVKRLVEAHGGTVRVVDGPGGGSRFEVEIPAAAEGG